MHQRRVYYFFCWPTVEAPAVLLVRMTYHRRRPDQGQNQDHDHDDHYHKMLRRVAVPAQGHTAPVSAGLRHSTHFSATIRKSYLANYCQWVAAYSIMPPRSFSLSLSLARDLFALGIG